MKRRAVPKLVSRTTTPETARAEVFRLLWRVMSWNGCELPVGCARCNRPTIMAAHLPDVGNLCCTCALDAEKAGEAVEKDDTFDDVHRLEALGFLAPLDPADEMRVKDYEELVKLSGNRAVARKAGRD